MFGRRCPNWVSLSLSSIGPGLLSWPVLFSVRVSSSANCARYNVTDTNEFECLPCVGTSGNKNPSACLLQKLSRDGGRTRKPRIHQSCGGGFVAQHPLHFCECRARCACPSSACSVSECVGMSVARIHTRSEGSSL
jgi:hypothetical protein